MSFSCVILGKNGEDLLKKYNIHEQLLGLAPNFYCDSDYDKCEDSYEYNLQIIRAEFIGSYKDDGKTRSQRIVDDIKYRLIHNIEKFEESYHHCSTCTCKPPIQEYWDVEMAKRFISIPTDEVEKAYGGN